MLKLSLFVNDMTLYIEILEDSTKEAGVNKGFNTVAGYKINTKCILFPYTNNKTSERQIMNIISFTIALKE